MRTKKFFVGFSLLEVMVSLAVVSIGSLGYVKSQITTLKNVSDIMARTVANTLVEDMASRMQANASETWAGVDSNYLNTGLYNAACNGGVSGTTSICSGAEMARNDVQEWTDLVTTALPASMGPVLAKICLESPAGTFNLSNTNCGTPTNAYPLIFTIKIYWKSSQSLSTYDQAAVATVEAPLNRIPIFPLPGPPPNTGSGQYK
jgi:type IV pilus modification protein PilV